MTPYSAPSIREERTIPFLRLLAEPIALQFQFHGRSQWSPPFQSSVKVEQIQDIPVSKLYRFQPFDFFPPLHDRLSLACSAAVLGNLQKAQVQEQWSGQRVREFVDEFLGCDGNQTGSVR